MAENGLSIKYDSRYAVRVERSHENSRRSVLLVILDLATRSALVCS